MTGGWHSERKGARLTLTRRAGLRADLSVETRWPVAPEPVRADAFRLSLAHQVRQDMWRALQSVRGLVPVIGVETVPGSVHVCAGVALSCRPAPEARIRSALSELLTDTAARRRWTTHALKAGGAFKCS